MQLPTELQSISDKIRLAEEEEKKRRELERATQKELIAKANESVSTGVDASSLPQDKLQLFQKLIEENLLRREAALKFFEEQMKRDPNVEARRLKQADREGRNPVANFFRNLDYALGDGAGRDKAIAQKQISDARTSYDSLAKDQGLEINRAIGDQNKLFTALKGIEQRGTSSALGAQGKMMQNDTAAALGGQRNTIAAGRADSQNALDAEKANLLQQQVETTKLRNQYFTPMGVGQDAAFAALIERMRKTDPKGAAELEAKGRENAMVRSAIGGMFKPQGGQTSTTTRPNVHWTKDYKGRDVEVRGDPITTTTTRGGGGMGVDPTKFLQGLLNKGETGRDSASPIEALRSAVNQAEQNRAAKPASIVNQALVNTENRNDRVSQAAQAVTKNLSPSQIQEDEKKRRLGYRWSIDVNPAVKQGKPGTRSSAEIEKAVKLDTTLRSEMTTASNFMLEAASTGVLDRAMGKGNNPVGADQRIGEILMPNILMKQFGTDAYNPDYELRRLFPGLDSDEDTRDFRAKFTEFMSSMGFNIQKDATGLQALGQEMERIKSRLPKDTDNPTMALTAMLTLSTKKLVEGYLLTRGYDDDTSVEVARLVGDYVMPRVKYLKDKVQTTKADLKALYANGRIPANAANKKFSAADLDPADMIGAAIEAKGLNFEDFPISIRKLTSKTTSNKSPQELRSAAPKTPPNPNVAPVSRIPEKTGNPAVDMIMDIFKSSGRRILGR